MDLLYEDADVAGCTDIDDALHARQLPNGNIEAGVRKSRVPLLHKRIRSLHYQTLLMCHILSCPIMRWTPKLPPEVQRSISSTSESTCCQNC